MRVVVRMGVDDAGSHHEADGVELDGRRLLDASHGNDAAVPNADIGLAAGLSGAVDERAGSDDVVEHGTSGGERSAGAPSGQNLTARQPILAANCPRGLWLRPAGSAWRPRPAGTDE